MEELKPCPLCDAESRHYMSMHKHNVGCTKCPLKIKGYHNKADAITAWNTRPSPWIKITPETMPEVNTPMYTDHAEMKGICHLDEKGLWWESGNRVTQPNHYMPIPPIPEEN